MPYTFSPSSLSLLKDCPRCFWLHFKKGIKQPSGIFPSLPSGMDKVLKEHFDRFRAKGTLPPELKDMKGVKLFADMDTLRAWRKPFTGVRWKDEQGNLLRGAVDDMLEKDGKLIVLDYKTRGYPIKEDTADTYQNQLDIYNFLLRKNGRETEDYAYLLFIHPLEVDEKGRVIFHAHLVKRDISVKNAERVFKKALEVLAGPMPKSSETCDACRWARECP